MPEKVNFVPFRPWVPDGREHGIEALGVAKNVMPIADTWRSWPQFTSSDPTNTVANQEVNKSWAHIYPSGVGTATYVGDNVTEFYGFRQALYTKPFGGAWANISRGGGYAAATQPAAWCFASFGNDIWAANSVDALQRRTNNAGNFANGPASVFVPVPRFIAPVRDFMVAANFNQAGRTSDEIAWSNSNDATWWDDRTGAQPASLAGIKPVRSRPGQITGLVGGEHGRIFKRFSMHALSFTGGNDVWRLDEISPGVGTAWPGSIIQAPDGYVYFLAADGFYRQIGLSAPEKLPGISQRISDRSIYSDALGGTPPALMYAEDKKIVGVPLPSAGMIVWLVANSSLRYDIGFALETSSLRWSQFEPTTLNQISSIHTVPVNVSGADWMADVAGSFWDGTVLRRWAWGATGSHALTIATDRFALSFGEDGQAQAVTINGVNPILAERAAVTGPLGITDYALNALPSATKIRLWGSNDPLFTRRNDALGTQINPRVSEETLASVDEQGYIPNTMTARWFVLELSIPIGTHVIQSMPGVYVRQVV